MVRARGSRISSARRRATRTLVIVSAAPAAGVADASAAGYTATLADGGRIALNVSDGRLLRACGAARAL